MLCGELEDSDDEAEGLEACADGVMGCLRFGMEIDEDMVVEGEEKQGKAEHEKQDEL